MIKISKKISLLGLFIILFKIFIILYLYINLFSKKNMEDRVIIIPRACTIKCTSSILLNANIIQQKFFFILYSKGFELLGKKIVAGEYEIAKGLNLVDIFDKITKGKVITHQVMFPEGLTNFQIVEILKRQYGIVDDNTKLKLYGEGELYPNTYSYFYGTKASNLLHRMHLKMKGLLIEEWDKRDIKNTKELKTPIDALILASIIEKEAKFDYEKLYIASVYLNRLKRRIPLQADPTVVFAISKGDNFNRKVTYKDLKFDSPYNTYLHSGLPPTPICNPGKLSISAALHPAMTNDLYFVADGSGKHIFANSYKQHMKNIKKIRSR